MYRSTIRGTVLAEQWKSDSKRTFVSNVSICVGSSGEDTLTGLSGQCISSTSTDINGEWESGLLVSGVYTITFSHESYIPHAIQQTVSAEGELLSVNTVLMSILDPEQLDPNSTRIAVCWDRNIDHDLSVVYIPPGQNEHVHVYSWSADETYSIQVSGDWDFGDAQYTGSCELARVGYTPDKLVVWIRRQSTTNIHPNVRFQAYASVDQTGPVKVLSTTSIDTEWPVFCIIGSDVLDPADTACRDFIETVNDSE
jgi:hypothetical protein